MKINLPDPLAINWLERPSTTVQGKLGFVTMQVVETGDIRIRLALYSPLYLADHWCVKGHIVQVLHGELVLEHEDGETMVLRAGMTYIVGDDRQPHRARTERGAEVMIFD